MKQRMISILMSCAVLVSLAACGGNSAGNAPDPGSSPAGPTGSSAPAGGQTANAFSFAANGTQITVNENMAGVLAALGEPQSYFEAESCAFEGLDKTYTYAGFVITTYPDGEQDFINSIRLTDDSAATQEGVYIGCTADQVRAAYGDAEDGPVGALSYTKGDTTLNFILEGDVVVSIEYLPV